MSKRKTDRDGLFRRKDSPHWWASYTDAKGCRVRRSTGTDNRREAEAKLSHWKAEVHQERVWGREPERTLHQLLLAYIDAHPEKRSLERDGYSTQHLYRLLGAHCILNTLSVSDIHQYTQTRRREGVAPATVNRELGLLSAALNWGRKTLGWDIPNPAQGQRLSEPTGRERWLTQEEAARLLEAAKQECRAPHLLDYILITLNTGMRSGEILSLEWERVDFKQDRILLGANHQKSGKPGMVPLNQTARAALLSRARFRARYCPATPWVFSDRAGCRIASIKRSFASACRRAGIKDCTPHDLRRTCGSWLVQNRVPIQEVAKLLRHADIRVTERVYAHLLPDQLKVTVQVLDRHDLVTLDADKTHLDRLSH